jgi:hypothetical protein
MNSSEVCPMISSEESVGFFVVVLAVVVVVVELLVVRGNILEGMPLL